MAVDRYTIEYHLTDEGWIAGSTTFFNNEDHHLDRPAGAHETWVFESSQASGWSQEETRWRLAWTNPESPTDHIKGLHSKYPHKHD